MTEAKKGLLNSVILIAVILMAAILPVVQANALTSSSVLLSDPRAGETSEYTFTASGFNNSQTIRCMDLDFSVNSDGTGEIPGFSAASFALTEDSTLVSAAPWTESATAGNLRLENATPVAPAASGSLVLTPITNGSTADTSYFVTLKTYTDGGCNLVEDSVVVKFIYTNGTLVSLTIDPTLTFTVSPVASGVNVNGAETTIASTASAIAFGNAVTSAANGVSAHGLVVGTNANNGYTVYIRSTDSLSNGLYDIADVSGPNSAPSAFPAAGTEAWGYTTNDSTLDVTANRFTSPSQGWAYFTDENEIVAYNTSAVSGTETTTVSHQVGIAPATPAGTYQTTIIYTVASVY